MPNDVAAQPQRVSGRRLLDVAADFVGGGGGDLTAVAVLDRLGGAIREALPDTGALVTLAGGSGPVEVVIVAGDHDGAIEVPLTVGDEHLGTLRLAPGPAVASEDIRAVADSLAGVVAACLRASRTNEALRRSLERSRVDALHDPLTGMPNRAMFLDRLESALARGRRSGRLVSVTFIDLDRFKRINDAYGHVVGDELLRGFAGRLAGALRPSDTAARLGGDEFVVLCEDLRAEAQAEAIGRRLGDLCAAPFDVAGHRLHLTASVGVASATARHDAASLLDDADGAMYQAKRRGGHCVEVIDLRSGTAAAPPSDDFARDLEAAVRGCGLLSTYEPVVGTVDGRMAWARTRVGWVHPVAGAVGGGELARLAARQGLGATMARTVIERACTERARLGADGRRAGVEVGVSTAQLIEAGFAAMVADVLATTRTEARLLILALDEDVVGTFADRAGPVLEELAALGVTLALDGFDAARSTLGSLGRSPLDVVRLDDRVVTGLGDAANHALVFATVEMAHLLGLAVVADGVATEEHRGAATVLGCDFSQGRLFGPTVPAGELVAGAAR